MRRFLLAALVIALFAGSAQGGGDEGREVPLAKFDELWDYGDPAATEAKFRALLPEAESGGDASLHAQLLSQIARTEGLQRRFEEADSTLLRAEALLTADMPLAQARVLLERGRLLNSSGESGESARAVHMMRNVPAGGGAVSDRDEVDDLLSSLARISHRGAR